MRKQENSLENLRFREGENNSGNMDDAVHQNDEDNRKYSPKRKYIWAGIGAGIGALYGTPFSLFTGLGGSALSTFDSMKVLLGYPPSYHHSSVDTPAILLNSLLWAAVIGTTTYFFKKRKEKRINDAKPKTEEKVSGMCGYLDRQIKKTRWAFMGSVLALGIGLPVVVSGAAELRKHLTPKTPSGYERVLSNDTFGEMSCSPLEEKIVYYEWPWGYGECTKAGVLRAGGSAIKGHPSLEELAKLSSFKDVSESEINFPIKLLDIKEQKTYDLGVRGFDPVWGFDVGWIYYTRYADGEVAIYKVRPDGREETLVKRGMALSSFSESGKMVKVDKEGCIWIDDRRTPFEGIEPFLIEDKDLLVYYKFGNDGVFRGNLKTEKETLLSSRTSYWEDGITIPMRGPYKGKVIASAHDYGIYIIDPETGEENLLKEKRNVLGYTDIDVSPDGSKLYVGIGYHRAGSLESALCSFPLTQSKTRD